MDKPIREERTKEKTRVGTWTAHAKEYVEKDWHYYSKAWHRCHGPRITVLERYVEFISDGGQKRRVTLDSWRGNWMLNALVQASIVRPRSSHMAIRLHPALDIRLVREARGYRLYQRLLKGEPYDYCIVSPMGMTYHGESYRDCLRGLMAKRKAMQLRQEGGVVDLKLLKRLGFCDPGIREFCSRFGYSLDDTTSPAEVYRRVKKAPHLAAPFLPELRILARALNFEAPELAV